MINNPTMANSKITKPNNSRLLSSSQEAGWQNRFNALVQAQIHPYKHWYQRWWGKIIIILL